MSEARRRFVCVNHSVPPTTTRLLREACESRGVLYEEIDADEIDFTTLSPLPPGSLMYRPAVSNAATRLEQALFGPGVATFYREPDGVFREIGPDFIIYERAGLPVAKWVWGNTSKRDVLRRYVEHLGGLPIVLKFRGGSGGVGVLRIDTLAGLFSTMDHALASGRTPVLETYVTNATHWRCVVVGEDVVGFYKNRMQPDDFRTRPSEDPADYHEPPPAEIRANAVRATASLEIAFGGVDILVQPDGRQYVLEVNCPCYFGRAQVTGGHDVAGAMIDWLVKKAEKLESGR